LYQKKKKKNIYVKWISFEILFHVKSLSVKAIMKNNLSNVELIEIVPKHFITILSWEFYQNIWYVLAKLGRSFNLDAPPILQIHTYNKAKTITKTTINDERGRLVKTKTIVWIPENKKPHA